MVSTGELSLETIRKWQDDNWAYSKMKEWIGKRGTDLKDVPRDFKSSYKNFRVEKNVLMYASHISDLAPVAVIPQTKADVVLEKCH